MRTEAFHVHTHVCAGTERRAVRFVFWERVGCRRVIAKLRRGQANFLQCFRVKHSISIAFPLKKKKKGEEKKKEKKKEKKEEKDKEKEKKGEEGGERGGEGEGGGEGGEGGDGGEEGEGGGEEGEDGEEGEGGKEEGIRILRNVGATRPRHCAISHKTSILIRRFRKIVKSHY